jgi:hypothetical protein
MTQAMQVLACLPATPVEIAAGLGWKIKAVHDVLCALRLDGLVLRTDRWVVREGKTGPARSRLWVLTPDGEGNVRPGRVTVSDADIARAAQRGIQRRYVALKRECAALHWKQRHAFTGMGLE